MEAALTEGAKWCIFGSSKVIVVLDTLSMRYLCVICVNVQCQSQKYNRDF